MDRAGAVVIFHQGMPEGNATRQVLSGVDECTSVWKGLEDPRVKIDVIFTEVLVVDVVAIFDQ